MRIHWIWLANRPGLSERETVALLEYFPDAEDLYFADNATIAKLPGLREKGRLALADKDLTGAEKILEDCSRLNIQVLTFAEDAYPFRLKQIPDPPMVLYYKGTLPDFNVNPVVGVVGTRKASAYGLGCARRLGYQIGKCGSIVVSGIAYGVDAMAMSGALLAGQVTVGILGSGADVVYPKSNRNLYREVEKYGCLISEFAPGTPPLSQNFPKRNRIISGLSNGVLVVEAPEGSGALITAQRALNQGRDVFVVPGNIDQPGFYGSNQLLKEGAALADCGWDVVSEYQNQYPDKLHREDGLPAVLPEEKPVQQVAQTAKIPVKTMHLQEPSEKKPIDKSPSTAYSDVNIIAKTLREPEKAIVLALASGERRIEDLIAETGIPAAKLLPSLTMLEIRGLIRRLGGKRISLK